MHVLPDYERILLLTEGKLGVFTSKTAAALLRYRPEDVVGVIDSEAAGTDIRVAIQWAPAVPILESVEAAAALRAQALFVGVAPVGGALSAVMRQHVVAALRAGLDVVSGLHTQLGEDSECAAASDGSGARIFDLRHPPAEQVIASGRARDTRARRILTVGTDCNVGKMVASVEFARAAQQAGLDARFVATGQTGTMIAGRGIAVDAVVADFAAGAVETLVCAAGDADLLIVEGQGSLGHPAYSAVTLALLHGTCPSDLILVHHAGRTHYRAQPSEPLPDARQLRDAYLAVADLLYPTRLLGIMLNTHGLSDSEAADAARRYERMLGVPAADPWREGCGHLIAAL